MIVKCHSSAKYCIRLLHAAKVAVRSQGVDKEHLRVSLSVWYQDVSNRSSVPSERGLVFVDWNCIPQIGI